MHTRTSVGRDFQDNLLGRLMEQRQITTIYLRNRMSVRGRILTFDAYVLLLDPFEGGPAQMIYKSAVVSISGPRPMGRRPGGPGGPGGPRRGPGGAGGPGGPRPPRPPYGPRDGEGGAPRYGSGPRDSEGNPPGYRPGPREGEGGPPRSAPGPRDNTPPDTQP